MKKLKTQSDTVIRADVKHSDTGETHKYLLGDFIVLFNNLWYRNFPSPKVDYISLGRANWTIHIGLIIRECADLLGCYAKFESGRTDAIIYKPSRDIAQIEWEWYQPHSVTVNELDKLSARSGDFEFSVFISYCAYDKIEIALNKVKTIWAKTRSPLLLFLVMFYKIDSKGNRKADSNGGKRRFDKIFTYIFEPGKDYKLIRTQSALPWEVNDSKW